MPAEDRPHYFDVTVDRENWEVRIIACGELDRAVREQLDDLVDEVARSEPFFLIDCADLTFIDAGGISSLIRAHALGATVVGVSGTVGRTLAMVGLSEVLCHPAKVVPACAATGAGSVGEAGG